MRITNNTVSESIVSQIQQLGTQQAKLQTQVATGQRIFQPEDDPAAVGRVLDLQSEQRSIAQYKNNAARALELSQASYSSLKSLKTVSDRANQIATLGTGALNASQSQAYASEVNQLIEQTVQLGNSKFGNDFLFAGTAVSTTPFTVTRDDKGNITGVSYQGNDKQQQIPLSEITSVTPGTNGTMNRSIEDFVKHLVSLRDALNSGSSTDLATVQGDLANTEDVLVASLADAGGVQARIEAHKTLQTNRATDIESLISDEADVDLPSTMVKLSQAQTAYQAALQSGAGIMRTSLLDYIK